ncbi:MAG: MFS transporter [Thermoleophilia bacterium]
MTAAQRRVILAICITVWLTSLVSLGLTFIVEPMSEDLDIGNAGVEIMLATPAISALVAIFIVGQAADRIGQRRTLLLLIGAFTTGSLLVASAQEGTGVIVGLALCGSTVWTVPVVALSLLQETAPDGKARVSAFTTYGIVYPLALLTFPSLTGLLLRVAVWRLVPLVWAAAGLVMAGAVMVFVKNTHPRRPFGEWLSLLFFGVALAMGVRFLNLIVGNGITSPVTLIVLAILIAAMIALALRVRLVATVSFSVAPIRGARMRALLLTLVVVQMVGTLTYIVLVLEYTYGESPLEASIVVFPALVGAVLGAKVLCSAAIHRWDMSAACRRLTLVVALSMLPLCAIHASSPAWYVVLCATLFMTAFAAANTALVAEVMSHAPPGGTGSLSAFRGMTSAIGSGLSVIVLGTPIIAAVDMSNGGEVSADQVRQLAWGLRYDGIVGFMLVIVAWRVLVGVERRAVRRGPDGRANPASS